MRSRFFFSVIYMAVVLCVTYTVFSLFGWRQDWMSTFGGGFAIAYIVVFTFFGP